MVSAFLGDIATGLGTFVPAFFGAILEGFTSLFIATGEAGALALTPVGSLAVCFIIIGIAYKIAPTVLGFLRMAFKKKGKGRRKRA